MNDGDLIFNTRLDTAGLKSGLQGAGGEILKMSTQAAAKSARSPLRQQVQQLRQ